MDESKRSVLVYPAETLAEVAGTLTDQLMESSRKTYEGDYRVFAYWLHEQGLGIAELTYEHMVAFRTWLIQRRQKNGKLYAKATIVRIMSVARSILREAMKRGIITANPADGLRSFKLDNESPRSALTKEQCEQMLKAINRATPKGKRDFALLSLLIRTGIRRAELVELKINDLSTDGGFYIATIRHGKGDKRRIVKLPNDVHFAIQEYLLTRQNASPDAPLFVGIRKSLHSGEGTWKNTKLHVYGGINYIISEHAKAIGIELTPHNLRATFITLALEEGAALHKVQYAAGHSDPRTTERYHKRKLNLADNATDYIKFNL